MYSEDEMLMLSGLQHFAFCERQWALIYLEQQWADSYDTARGDLFHERVDTKGYSSGKGIRAVRAMRLESYELGIYGIADIVEFGEVSGIEASGDKNDADNRPSVRPVEYKVGKPKAEDWDRIQLCAQALCLEEMYGCTIDEGAIFYGETRHREKVPCDRRLKMRVAHLAQRMHKLFDEQITPSAQKKSRCRRCSLLDICLPEAGGSVTVEEYWRQEGFF